MMFGDNPQAAPDYPRIVSPTAMQRLIGYIDKGNIVFGGRYDLADKYIEPTVVDNLTADAGLLSEEIFGPIFPLMTFDDIQEVITYINEREKPLALYSFRKTSKLFIKYSDKPPRVAYALTIRYPCGQPPSTFRRSGQQRHGSLSWQIQLRHLHS